MFNCWVLLSINPPQNNCIFISIFPTMPGSVKNSPEPKYVFIDGIKDKKPNLLKLMGKNVLV